MSEIADDVKISKANLYYYFSDKWALVEAIVNTLIEESDKEVEDILSRESGVEYFLLKMLDIKFEYFSKYQLLVQNLHDMNLQDERFRQISCRVFEREQDTVAQILERGINSGQLVTMDILSMSKLYTTILRGLAMYCIYETPGPYVDLDALRSVHEQQKAFVKVFMHGISLNSKLKKS